MKKIVSCARYGGLSDLSLGPNMRKKENGGYRYDTGQDTFASHNS